MLKAILLLTLLAPFAHGEYSEFNVDDNGVNIPPPAEEPVIAPATPSSPQPEESVDAPPPVKQEAKEVKSRRFNSSDRERFDHWLVGLCTEKVDALPEHIRIRTRKNGEKVFAKPNYRLGALTNLLENYIDLVGTSHLGEIKKVREALRRDFSELRDVSDLNGKSDRATAKKLLARIKGTSQCHTRSTIEIPLSKQKKKNQKKK